jgi:hypothetical protein
MDNLLQIPTLTTPSLNNVELMVQEVADLVGGSDDVDIREKAMRMLDRAADRMNSAGVFLFRRKENAFTSFTTGQSTLALPSDWGWATDPMVAYDTLGNTLQVIEWKTWEIYRSLLQTTVQNITGVPNFASLLSEMDALIYLYPYIDSAKVTTIKATYFARILRISEVSDGNVFLSPEGRECLITGGQAMMMRQRFLTKPAIWEPMMQDFDRQITLAKSAAFRQQQAEHISARPDEAGGLATGVFTPGPRVTVYLGF